jgi:oxygen-independent coproporphyrinogen-3 oxidase
MFFVPSEPHNPPLNLPQFTKYSGATQEKTATSTIETANPWLATASGVCGLYVHVPFCFHKCHYCDFFSIVGDEQQQELFIEKLISEFVSLAPYIQQPIETIFIGGGTPTLLQGNLLSNMLEAIATNFTFSEKYEWTIEANPETVTPDIASRIADSGVNRASIGAQSFDKECLKTLERWHAPESVASSVAHLRNAGIDNINLDLIFGIPHQTIDVFRDDLQKTIALEPEHISAYALTYEPNTPLYVREKRGEVQKIDEDLESQMFEETMSILGSHNYEQYEISNYAKPDRRCSHNLMYWNNKSWWPFGPAAAGHVAGRRWRNIPRLSQYITDAKLPPVEDIELLSENSQAGEALMLGLRLRAGIPSKRVEQLLTVQHGQWRRQVFDRYIAEGLLIWDESLRLTGDGIMVADSIIKDLLMEETPMVDTTMQVPDAKK